MALIGALTCFLVGTSAAVVSAAPSDQQERIASGLHQKALEHFREGRYAEAIQNWEAAEALHRHWKYAFNMAMALQTDEQWLRAWDACKRTRDYGLPERNLAALSQLVEVVEGELFTDHAYIALEVTPADANVIRNGGLWQAPRALWTRDGLSDLVVSHGVHGVKQEAWKHPPGKRYTLKISLLAAPEAKPEIPEPKPEAPKQDEPRSQPETDKPETDKSDRAETPQTGETPKTDGAATSTSTPPDEGPPVAKASTTDAGISATATPTDGPPVMGWVSLGVGGAGLVGAIVALNQHATLADELTELNENPPSDSFAAYREAYNQKSAEAADIQAMGFVAATTGTLLLSLGAYWLLTDDAPDETEGGVEAALAPVPLPGGAGLSLGGRF